MRASILAAVALVAPIFATTLGPDRDGKYTISTDKIKLQFIPYGAAITNLFINSKQGQQLDVVLGWDNATYYSVANVHPYFGGIVGRYANRIKNSTFTIKGLDGKDQTSHITPNDNPTPAHPKGVDTLHGGPNGTDWRNWTVVSHTPSSITFSLLDPDGEQGFPGDVTNYVTYTVKDWEWDIRIVAVATTKRTPIMLTSHAYWNLDGFKNPATPYAHNHSLHLPFAQKRIATDTILIPTGEIVTNTRGGVNDFWSKPRQLGAALGDKAIVGNCGFNCSGYDNCYVHSARKQPAISPRSNWLKDPVAILSSAYSGIKLTIFSDQNAFQVYSCPGQNGTVPLKKTQGISGRKRVVEKYGCVVMEVQDYIDGVNHPEWGRIDRQVFGPDTNAFELGAKYVFSVEK